MPPRFTLWHSRDTRSLRILWTFEELGLRRGRDYALRVLTFPPRVHHPEFLATNRLGTVPFFEHREQWDAAPRAAMSESCAVPIYLADLHRSPLALQMGEHDYPAFLNWVMHADATLTFPQAVVMRYALFERGRTEARVASSTLSRKNDDTAWPASCTAIRWSGFGDAPSGCVGMPRMASSSACA